MVPLFFDEALMLGYAQSKLVGAGGQIHATDHRFLTDDISPSRWAASYEAEGLDEIAVALSQKNTIPSVSAVMFRRGTLGALAPFLTDFRSAGDWWIYLEMARRGDVAFVARALNRRRRPDASTAEGGNGEAGPLAETLRIKAGLFRDLDLPSNVIHRSLGASVHDHVLRSREPGGAIPRLAQHPGATSSLQAMRGRLDARLGDIGVLRLLLVDGADLKLARTAATLLSNRATSFLLADEPSGEGAPAVEEPMLLFEGTRGVAPWAAARSADGRDLGPEHRVEVLCELARFHRIDALVSLGAAGHDLAPRLAARAGLPWLVVLTSDTTLPKRARKKLEAGSDGLISTPGRLAQALHGDGAAQFLQAVAQAVERRRDRLAASSPEATPDAMPTG
jgi:hypothetical protein